LDDVASLQQPILGLLVNKSIGCLRVSHQNITVT
jgi:hypothetical protein